MGKIDVDLGGILLAQCKIEKEVEARVGKNMELDILKREATEKLLEYRDIIYKIEMLGK